MAAKEKQAEIKKIFGYLTGVPGEMQVIIALSSTRYTIVPITLVQNTAHTDVMAIPTKELEEAVYSYNPNPAVKMRRIDAKYSPNCPTVHNYYRESSMVFLGTNENTWGTYAGEEPLYIAYVWNGDDNPKIVKDNARIALSKGKERARKKNPKNGEEEIEYISYFSLQEMVNLYRNNTKALTTGFILYELKGIQDIYQEMQSKGEDIIKIKGVKGRSEPGVLIPLKRYLFKYGAVLYRFSQEGQKWTTEIIGEDRPNKPPAKSYKYEDLCEMHHYGEYWQAIEHKSKYDYIRYMRQDEHDKKAKEANSRYFRKFTALRWRLQHGDTDAITEMNEKATADKEFFAEYYRLIAIEVGIPTDEIKEKMKKREINITIGQLREAMEQARKNIEAQRAAEEKKA